MKKNLLIVTFLLLLILSVHAEENFFKKLHKGKYHELINRINENRKEDIDLYSEDILNGILMISYLGVEDYSTALSYSKKLLDINDTHSLRPYITIIKYKNDIIDLKEALSDLATLMISSDFSYNICDTIINFQIEYNDFDNAKKYLDIISSNYKEDTVIFSLKSYLILKKTNVNEFIDNWYKSKSDDIQSLASLATPFINKNIIKYLKDNNQNLILSIYYYINEEFEESKEEFKIFLSENVPKSESEFIEKYCSNFSDNIVNIAKTLYKKYQNK